MTHRFKGWALAAVALGSLAACTQAPQTEAPAAPAAASYTDPFAYCAAVGTIDAPDARYTGPAMPDSVVEKLMAATGASADAPKAVFAQNSSWRCMDGRVYACTVGANLPCSEKADVSRTPSPAMTTFCRGQADGTPIPAYVTGRATVYAWQCRGGAPQIERQVTEPDAQGFRKDVWYALK